MVSKIHQFPQTWLLKVESHIIEREPNYFLCSSFPKQNMIHNIYCIKSSSSFRGLGLVLSLTCRWRSVTTVFKSFLGCWICRLCRRWSDNSDQASWIHPASFRNIVDVRVLKAWNRVYNLPHAHNMIPVHWFIFPLQKVTANLHAIAMSLNESISISLLFLLNVAARDLGDNTSAFDWILVWGSINYRPIWNNDEPVNRRKYAPTKGAD